jgi:polyhydroxyalkanoate synthesis repressor PhaR
MPQIKLIKRYANRRLYDAETSRTITLDDVAESIRSGREVRIVDNQTGDDITSQVLGQTFLKISAENERGEFNTFLLTALIRGFQGDVSGFFKKVAGIDSDNLSQEKIERIVQSMVEKGDLQIEEKTDYVEMILRQIQERVSQMEESVEEGIDFLQKKATSIQERKIEELSGKIEDMVRIIRELRK